MAKAFEPRRCQDCQTELVALRRVSRTTYYCPLKWEKWHKDRVSLRKYREQTARIEAIISRREKESGS